MNQIEFDQEILRLREEKKEKLGPLWDQLKQLDQQANDLHIEIQRLNVRKLELNKERSAVRGAISDIEHEYRNTKWRMNWDLNVHKMAEAKEEE